MRDVLSSALKSLSRTWLHTLLTVSGITVGVIMVVIVSLISNAGKAAVNSELDNMGMNGLSVSTGSAVGGLTQDDLQTIRRIGQVEEAMPLMIEFSSSLLCNVSNSAMICGIDSGTTQVISLKLEYGRAISPGDVEGALPVCMLDETVAREAYQRANVTGKTIVLQIGGVEQEFEIIGVTATGSSLLQNVTEFIPGMVYIPYTTMQNLTGRETFDQIAVRVRDGSDVEHAQTSIVSALERSGGLEGLYRTDNLAVQKERLSGLMDIVTLVLTAISGISLLVSGLSIMTIMLVSVNERTREIGIKKAIGASSGRILWEFLAEAVIISLLGSLAGILLGGGLCWLGMTLVGVRMTLSLTGLLGLIGFSVALGALFGVYPAVKAAKMRPVEALRRD